MKSTYLCLPPAVRSITLGVRAPIIDLVASLKTSSEESLHAKSTNAFQNAVFLDLVSPNKADSTP